MRKIVALGMALLLCLALLSGCAGAMEPEPDVVTVYTLVSNPAHWSMNDVYRYALDQFAAGQDDIILDLVEFPDAASLDTQLSADMEQGEGPDLILYSWLNSYDLHKFAAKGYFRDLNIYLEEDAGFDRANYNESLLNEGVYENAQVVLPLGFQIPMVLTTQERLADAGYAYDGEVLSSGEILDVIAADAERYRDNPERFGYIDLQQGNSFPFFIVSSGIVRMDYENQTVAPDREELKKLVELYNAALAEHERSMAATGGNPRYNNDPNLHLQAGTMYHCVVSPLEEMLRNAVIMEGAFQETPIIQCMPGYQDADTYYVQPLMAAVNRYSDKPEAAYEIIRYLMDTPIEQGTEGMVRPDYWSVNIDVALRQFEAAYRSVTNLEPAGSEQYRQLLSAYETMLYGKMLDIKFPMAVQSLVGACTRTYREDPAKMDAAIDNLIVELEAYLAE